MIFANCLQFTYVYVCLLKLFVITRLCDLLFFNNLFLMRIVAAFN